MQTQLCEWSTVSPLLRTLQIHRHDSEVADACVCALRHLTSKHELAVQAQDEIRNTPGGLHYFYKLHSHDF
jgi:hypothetical protein